MYDGVFPPQSNSANWLTEFQVLSDDTGEPLPIPAGTVVRLRLKGKRATVLDGSTLDGSVEIANDANGFPTILKWDFDAGRMRAVCSGAYEVFCRFEFPDGYVEQAIIGSISVLDGGF